MGKAIDIKGQKFNKLTALHKTTKTNRGEWNWKCLCDCGKETEVTGSLLRNSRIKSCGCARNVNWILKNKPPGYISLKKRPLYTNWRSMRNRCLNPLKDSYSSYGGRGIKCLWKSYLDFEKDMLPSYKNGLTLDRIDVDGNYCKENCRWATPLQQANNRRNNIRYELHGKHYTAPELARMYGIKFQTIYYRLAKANYSVKKAIKLK